jgi:hypothetical protein
LNGVLSETRSGMEAYDAASYPRRGRPPSRIPATPVRSGACNPCRNSGAVQARNKFSISTLDSPLACSTLGPAATWHTRSRRRGKAGLGGVVTSGARQGSACRQPRQGLIPWQADRVVSVALPACFGALKNGDDGEGANHAGRKRSDAKRTPRRPAECRGLRRHAAKAFGRGPTTRARIAGQGGGTGAQLSSSLRPRKPAHGCLYSWVASSVSSFRFQVSGGAESVSTRHQ